MGNDLEEMEDESIFKDTSDTIKNALKKLNDKKLIMNFYKKTINEKRKKEILEINPSYINVYNNYGNLKSAI